MRTFLLYCSLLLLLTTGACASMKRAAIKQAILYGLSPEQREYVKRETKPGGKLDFLQQLASGQTPSPSMAVLDQLGVNRRDVALQLWGKAVQKIGVDNADNAVKLYEDVTSTRLADPQRQALRKGYAARD